MESVQALLDKAAKVCGSRYALAKRLGVAESNLTSMAKGRRPIPATLAGDLADIIGRDPREAACAALVEQEKDPDRARHLLELFRLAPAAAAIAVTVLLGATSPTAEAALTNAHASAAPDRLYIMSTRRRGMDTDSARTSVC